MKKIVSFMIALSLACTACLTGFAYADKNWFYTGNNGEDLSKNYDYYEDFSGYEINSKPTSFAGITEYQNTSMYVVKGTTEEGKEKNLLKLEDNNPSGNIYFDVPVNQKEEKVLVETKIKLVGPEGGEPPSFRFELRPPHTTTAIANINQGTSTVKYIYLFMYGGYNQYPVRTPLENDVWYELQMLLNKTTGTVDAQIKSIAFANKTMVSAGKYDPDLGVTLMTGVPAAEGTWQNGVSTARIQITSRTGSMYVDYVRVKDGAGEIKFKGKPKEKIPLPEIDPFVRTAAEDMININYKGEYLFFPIKPFVENGNVYAPLRILSSAYGFDLSYKDGVYTLSKDGKEVLIDSSSIKINGENISAQSPVTVRSGIYCISVLDFAKAMGDTAEYEKDVIIR